MSFHAFELFFKTAVKYSWETRLTAMQLRAREEHCEIKSFSHDFSMYCCLTTWSKYRTLVCVRAFSSSNLYTCTWQHWLKVLLRLWRNKHAVKNDTQKKTPMCGVSNGLWAIKLTGSIQRAPNHPMQPSKILSGTSLRPLQTRSKKQRWLHAAARRLGDDDDKTVVQLGLDSPCWPCCSRGTRSSRVTRVT